MQTILAAVSHHTEGGERAAEYLQEALDKQPRVVFEGGVDSTEAGALPLGGGEEEAEGPHDLTRNSSRIPAVRTRSENFQKVTKQRNSHGLLGFWAEIYWLSSEIEAFCHET